MRKFVIEVEVDEELASEDMLVIHSIPKDEVAESVTWFVENEINSWCEDVGIKVTSITEVENI